MFSKYAGSSKQPAHTSRPIGSPQTRPSAVHLPRPGQKKRWSWTVITASTPTAHASTAGLTTLWTCTRSGAQPREQGIEIDVGARPRVEVRHDGHRTGRAHGAVVAADGEVHLATAVRQGVEEAEQGEVGAPAVTQPIRDVENPHRRCRSMKTQARTGTPQPRTWRRAGETGADPLADAEQRPFSLSQPPPTGSP